MRQPVTVESEEGFAPGIGAQKAVVADSKCAQGGIQGFDGGQSGFRIGMGFGSAGVGGSPSGGDGAGLDRFDGAAHGSGVAPTGIQQQQGASGIGGGKRRGVGRQQQMTGEIGLLPQGIRKKIQSGGAAERSDGAFLGIFTAPDDDQYGGEAHEANIQYPLVTIQCSSLQGCDSMRSMARVKLDVNGVDFLFRTELDVRITEINTFDLVCRAVREGDGAVVALAKTGMVAFDYARNRLSDLPPVFWKITGAKPA